ncbi:HIT domain-containing protein [Magnetofaba australis]|uniref:HIT domain-containing protein n=1 Tax=Magnetofaba australis TaxID=1472297 RepID=UPI0018E99898|nr:HIT domain-containing protein [Magnetofaba australis]
MTAQMPGRVLANNGVIIKTGQKYEFAELYRGVTPEERAELIDLCTQKLQEYLEGRPDPWNHRRKGSGYIPGSLRYDVLARAKGRCEACGVSAMEKALEVDHIIPRNHGGKDDPDNLQALCYTCNAQKRDRDQTDFREVAQSLHHRDESCIFCELERMQEVDGEGLAFVLEDSFPVSIGHTLILPRRHVADYFDLYQPERNAMERLLKVAKQRLSDKDPMISGSNIGVNVGQSAGQSVFHVHMHLIPRRDGDHPQPRGGVRSVIPGKADY